MQVFFSCTTNQSSWGYCNNYQNKHDDPCPTTVVNLTNLGQCKISCINFKATKVAGARFTDHKKFNMEPVWNFWVITLEMDPALKRTYAFIQGKVLSWPVLCMEISLHHVHHWPNQKQRIMVCFFLLWVGLIWITDMKIPQDVLKTISGHVAAKKWCVKNAVSTLILF